MDRSGEVKSFKGSMVDTSQRHGLGRSDRRSRGSAEMDETVKQDASLRHQPMDSLKTPSNKKIKVDGDDSAPETPSRPRGKRSNGKKANGKQRGNFEEDIDSKSSEDFHSSDSEEVRKNSDKVEKERISLHDESDGIVDSYRDIETARVDEGIMNAKNDISTYSN